MRMKYFTLFLWVVLGSLPVSAEVETDYLAVILQSKKIGYAVHTREVEGNKVVTSEQVNITFSRMNMPVSMQTVEKCVETKTGRPISFESVLEMSMMQTKVVGKITQDGNINIITTAPGGEQKSTLPWPEGALMFEGLRLLQKEHGLKEGTKYSAKVFVPSMLQGLDVEITIGAKKKVDLLGRVVPLTEATTKMVIPMAGEITSTAYVDDEYRVLKSIGPVMDMQLELISCPKEFALSENEQLDLLEKIFLKSPEQIRNVDSAESIKYYLSATGDAKSFNIPSTDTQSAEKTEDGKTIVTVRPVAAKKGVKFPYEGKDETILAATKPTRFLQSDQKEIIELAKEAIGDTEDTAEAVEKIESFVSEYVEEKNLSVGYASAAEVAISKEGDCSEHAVLAAAMCRALGIPAQVVAGVAYVDDFEGLQGFGPHAWLQAYIGDKWVGFDPTFKVAKGGGFDAGHIALAIGDGTPETFFSAIFSLGQFKINKVEVEK